MSKERILITGGGGREHALGWKLSQSESIDSLFFTPGNAGTETLGPTLDIDFSSEYSLLKSLGTHGINRVVVGPEDHLAMGIIDILQKEGIQGFGPTKEAALLETDKAWAINFMTRHQIPHPDTFIPLDYRAAKDMATRRNPDEIVLKATLPAKGKGVLLPKNRMEAGKFVDEVYLEHKFGKNQEIIIQRKLSGKEISFLVFSDGVHAVPLLPARDYKRIGDNDTGNNTGGMGAYAPRNMSPSLWNEAMEKILQPTIHGMAEEGTPFKGILYAGLMVTGGGLKVIEFNARFGDPETQPLMMLLKSDLIDIMRSIDRQELKEEQVVFRDGNAVCVILAAPGYPENAQIGQKIRGLELIGNQDVQVFHAATLNKGKDILVNGGRTLGVTAYGKTQEDARSLAYEEARKIDFEGKQMREDIAA